MRGESIAVHRVIPLTLTPVQRGRGDHRFSTASRGEDESFVAGSCQAGCEFPMYSEDFWVKGRARAKQVMGSYVTACRVDH